MSGKQLLSSSPPPFTSPPPNLSTTESNEIWTINAQKKKLKATLSKEPGNNLHSHVSLAPHTRLQNVSRKHCPSFIPPIQLSPPAFGCWIWTLQPWRSIHWLVASWFWIMTCFCNYKNVMTPNRVVFICKNKCLIMPSVLLSGPGQTTAALKFYRSQLIFSG